MNSKVSQSMNPNNHTHTSRKPFYKKVWAIILLVIFFPPIGIPLMFKFMNKPSQKAKIIISVIWTVLWISILVSSAMDSRREFDINGSKVTIQCSSYCSYIDEYAGKSTLKELAIMGIKEVKSAPTSVTNGGAIIEVATTSKDTDRLTLQIADKNIQKIYNTAYPAVVYFSIDTKEIIAKYPGIAEIETIKAKKAAEEAEKKKAEEAERNRKEQEEAARKVEEAKAPSAEGTLQICEKAFKSQYPYKGSKVHSIMGVIANNVNSTNTRLYKAEVTIQNAFGAEYSAVMECVVQKDGEMLSIKDFNVY